MSTHATTQASDDETAAIEAEVQRRVLAYLSDLVGILASTMPPSVELVVHDVSKLPNSVVAVSGNVTKRRVGDPATDLMLQTLTSGSSDQYVGYQTRLPDGREMRSSTLLMRGKDGEAFGAVCVNLDLTAWMHFRDLTEYLLQPPTAQPSAVASSDDVRPNVPLAGSGFAGEHFPHDVDELASLLVSEAIENVGIPVELMRKEHKLAVVEQLKARGMFLLREAVEMVASGLSVSRFTIYNYLNELEARNGETPEQQTEQPATARSRKSTRPTDL